MEGLHPNMSIITSNVSDLNQQVSNWQNGLKNMNQLYAIYKKLTSNKTIQAH